MKVAICIPCYGDTKAKFTQSLSKMLIHFHTVKLEDANGDRITPQVDVFMVSCSMLTESRHRLVAEAIHWGADYMLWLDADHVFPEDTLARLLSHGLPVVGANYARRFTPTAPTAAVDGEGDERKLLYTTLDKAQADLVEEVAHMGFGVCLMNMRVFDLLQEYAEEHGDGNFLPLFKFEPTPDKVGMIGEDVFFFGKLREAGVKLYVDHGLSWNVGHLHEQILTNAHACLHKDSWKQHKIATSNKFADRAAQLEEAA